MNAAPEYLIHETAESGHVRNSPRSEVATEVLDHLRPLLSRALCQPVAVALEPSDWWLSAREDQDKLYCRFWFRTPEGPPHLQQTVTKGDPPRVVVEGAGLLLAENPAAASYEAGDLERCIAWAWLSGTLPAVDTWPCVAAYRGRKSWGYPEVITPAGAPLSPEQSQAVWNHSPTGFEWGYGRQRPGPARISDTARSPVRPRPGGSCASTLQARPRGLVGRRLAACAGRHRPVAERPRNGGPAP